jgi:uncharacterized protein
MPSSRLLILIVGILLILGFGIWLIASLSTLLQSLSSLPTWLGMTLLGLLGVLLLVLIGALIYYLFLLPNRGQRRQRRRDQAPPQIAAVKQEVAVQNLDAVRQQMDQIQDQVQRLELLERSREIQHSLARGEVMVAVFGTGSAGKTSLINALMGRMVGQVGAAMGTTDVGSTYRLQLKGTDREIILADTPGILEAGGAGADRESRARHLAAKADLLLFVVDNDLRQSEYKPLRDLIDIGKRSVVVLNKLDLYTEADQALIVHNLRDRLQGLVNANDILMVSANPQAVKLSTGEVVKPEPDILPLIRRIAAIVRAEGDDLLADNILLQSQQLGEETRRLIDAQRRRQAEKLVDRYQWIGAGVIAVTPLPVVDLLATAAVNAQMVVELGKVYGCEINADRGRELAVSLAKTLVSLGVVKGAITLVTTAMQVSLVGLVLGRAIQGVSAAYLTRIAGYSFIEYFRQDQDWGDGGMAEVVQRQFQLNRKDEFVKLFVKDAIAKVVRPLQMEAQLEEGDDSALGPRR